MNRLGYDRYVALGGDTGATVTDAMGRLAPDGLLGILLGSISSGKAAPLPGGACAPIALPRPRIPGLLLPSHGIHGSPNEWDDHYEHNNRADQQH